MGRKPWTYDSEHSRGRNRGTAAIEHFLLWKVRSRLYWPFRYHVSRPNFVVPIDAVQTQGMSMFVIWEEVKDYIMG